MTFYAHALNQLDISTCLPDCDHCHVIDPRGLVGRVKQASILNIHPLFTSSFRGDLYHQILHSDMLQPLLLNHICNTDDKQR